MSTTNNETNKTNQQGSEAPQASTQEKETKPEVVANSAEENSESATKTETAITTDETKPEETTAADTVKTEASETSEAKKVEKLPASVKRRRKWLTDIGYDFSEALELAKKHNFQELREMVIRETDGTSAAEKPAGAKTVKTPPAKLVKVKCYMGVAYKNYPLTLLTKEQADQLKTAILKKVLEHKQTELKPSFDECVLMRGYLRVVCSDKNTQTWLRESLDELELWEGASLRAVAEKSLLRIDVYVGKFPDSADDTSEAILGFIESQNDGVKTAMWRVLERKVENKNVILSFTVDLLSKKGFVSREFLLKYKFGKVKLDIKEKPTLPTTGEAAKTVTTSNIRTKNQIAPKKPLVVKPQPPQRVFPNKSFVPIWDSNLPNGGVPSTGSTRWNKPGLPQLPSGNRGRSQNVGTNQVNRRSSIPRNDIKSSDRPRGDRRDGGMNPPRNDSNRGSRFSGPNPVRRDSVPNPVRRDSVPNPIKRDSVPIPSRRDIGPNVSRNIGNRGRDSNNSNRASSLKPQSSTIFSGARRSDSNVFTRDQSNSNVGNSNRNQFNRGSSNTWKDNDLNNSGGRNQNQFDDLPNLSRNRNQFGGGSNTPWKDDGFNDSNNSSRNQFNSGSNQFRNDDRFNDSNNSNNQFNSGSNVSWNEGGFKDSNRNQFNSGSNRSRNDDNFDNFDNSTRNQFDNGSNTQFNNDNFSGSNRNQFVREPTRSRNQDSFQDDLPDLNLFSRSRFDGGSGGSNNRNDFNSGSNRSRNDNVFNAPIGSNRNQFNTDSSVTRNDDDFNNFASPNRNRSNVGSNNTRNDGGFTSNQFNSGSNFSRNDNFDDLNRDQFNSGSNRSRNDDLGSSQRNQFSSGSNNASWNDGPNNVGNRNQFTNRSTFSRDDGNNRNDASNRGSRSNADTLNLADNFFKQLHRINEQNQQTTSRLGLSSGGGDTGGSGNRFNRPTIGGGSNKRPLSSNMISYPIGLGQGGNTAKKRKNWD